MCGLIGVVGDITKLDISFFRQALAANVVRGWDSTGVSAFTDESTNKHHNSDYVLWSHKEAITGSEAACDKEFNAVFNDLGNIAIMGHNRAATVGDVTRENAHPFSHGNLSLMHNGTLTDTSVLDGDFDTDSEQIAYTLSLATDKKAVLEKIEGAFALSWIDVGNNTFNLARNDERSLYITYSNKGDTLYYASEAKMLEWLLSRNKILHGDIIPLPVGEWLTVKLSNCSRGVALDTEVTKFTPFVLPSWTSKYYQQAYGGGSYFGTEAGETVNFQIESILKSHHSEGAYNITGYSMESNADVKGYAFSEESIKGFSIGDNVSGVSGCTSYYNQTSGYETIVLKKNELSIDGTASNTIIDTHTCSYCNTKVANVTNIANLDVCDNCIDEVKDILNTDTRGSNLNTRG